MYYEYKCMNPFVWFFSNERQLAPWNRIIDQYEHRHQSCYKYETSVIMIRYAEIETF